MNQFVIVTMVAIMAIACEPTERISGPITTEERDLADFDQLELRGVGDVEIISGAENDRIEITTHLDLMDNITTHVSNGRLIIDMNGNVDQVDKLDFVVYASDDISTIALYGVGDINYPGPMEVDELKIMLDGVGNIKVNSIKANFVEAHLKDVGNISLSGTSEAIYYNLQGTGNIEAMALESKTGEVRLKGVGNLEVYCSEELTISHDGVGKIYYGGHPDVDITTDKDIIGVD